MKNSRRLWCVAIVTVVLIALGVLVSVQAVQPLCLWCFDTQCVDIMADGYSTCIQLTNGCLAFGECSAGLTITQ